ncbi:Poly(A) RNA polymerase cid13 [Choanephora cucurbitarum]|uniref:polynucleotide adenylyltransferase n=1 Tax=Choanephora cucurbitarum TaxID=101091 RepID=A0A1C7MYW9_9FUNG|nr:Poly(A) RNA polymerase cid13 [Choanephora cucurbitarum]
MQASKDYLDTQIESNTLAAASNSIKYTPSPEDDLATDESTSPLIPYVLDIQQEDNLSIDVIQLYNDLLPSKESHDRRTKFVSLMERLLNNEWPDHEIKANVFGSSVNDLGTSSSDVDLCITTPWLGLRNVRILAKLFRRCGMQHVVCVPRAKVPIVRLFDPELQLSCDINVNNTLALQNTKMIKTYVALDPRVRPLIMSIKHWTKQRSLNDAANGGTLSSYTWTCMIINFLQQREPPILPVLHLIENEGKDEDYFYDNIEKLEGFGSNNHESLGGLLFAFFRRYAIEFDYNEQVVSVRNGRYLSKKEKGWDVGRNKISLCVEEPFNVGRNLGNSADVTSVHGLRCEFQRALDLLLLGEGLDIISKPYQPFSSTANADIPFHHDNNHADALSLTLPADNRHSPFLLSHSYNDSTHPYERRRSMVDGIYSYPSSSLPTHIHSYRAPTSSKALHLPSSTFHPRFSSPQALDSILKVRNTRHGSHPLPPVPSTLLSMLNISANHGTDQSVDKILARYHPRKNASKPASLQPLSETRTTRKTVGNTHYRRNKPHYHRHTPSPHDSSTANNNSGLHTRHFDRKPRRQSSGMEWPSILKNNNSNISNAQEKSNVWVSDQPQRSRRWSTTKATPDADPPESEPKTQVEPKKKTMAEIVKVHTPPTVKPKSPLASISSSSSKSDNKSNSKKQKNNNNKSATSSSSKQQKKKKH